MRKRCKPSWQRPFHCAECDRTHGSDVFRIEQLNGDILCNAGDNRRYERRMHNQRQAVLV